MSTATITKRLARWLSPTNIFPFLMSIVPMLVIVVFIFLYRTNMPRSDHGWGNAPAAIQLAQGTLTLEALFVPYFGHLVLFTRLQSLLFVQLTGWNVLAETWLPFVFTLLNYVMLLGLVMKTESRLIRWASVGFSVLMFAPQLDLIWVIPYYTQWLYPSFFFLAGLHILLAQWGYRSILLAGLLALFATFSNGNGIVLWGLFAWVIWRVYPKHRWLLVIWVGCALASLLTYMRLAGVALGTSGGAEREYIIHTPNPSVIVRYIVGFVGNTLYTQTANFHRSVWVGTAGLILGVINFAWLVRGEKRRALLDIWIPVAGYTLMTALLISLNRPDSYPQGIASAMKVWYKATTVYYWVGWLWLILLVWEEWRTRPTHLVRTLLVNINGLALALALVAFVYSNYMAVAETVWDQSKRLRAECYERYLFYQSHQTVSDQDCEVWGAEYVNGLALERLAIFAQRPAISILPTNYVEDTPILVESHNAWTNLHIRQWLLAGVDDADVLYLASEGLISDGAVVDYIQVTRPPHFVESVESFEPSIEAFLSATPQRFWHLTMVERPSQLTERMAQWQTAYLRYDLVVTSPDGIPFLLTRYERLPEEFEVMATVGDQIELLAVSGTAPEWKACDALTFRTLWRTQTPIEMGYGYSMTISLRNEWGEVLARTDAPLSYTESHLWEAGQVYLDERLLTLPCDLGAGRYQVSLGIYDWANPRLLPVQTDPSSPVDDWVNVGEFTIP
ncbi:MAG: hypothetical protein ACOYLB_08210 [Phototrophicaceae bacterium]